MTNQKNLNSYPNHLFSDHFGSDQIKIDGQIFYTPKLYLVMTDDEDDDTTMIVVIILLV
jgi:hypothetical protein